jgi:hypothetical protein
MKLYDALKKLIQSDGKKAKAWKKENLNANTPNPKPKVGEKLKNIDTTRNWLKSK